MPLELVHFLAAAVIGSVGSSAVLFASKMGLADYKELSASLFSPKYITIYVVLGALIAAILQLSSESFTPMHDLAVGAGWPAVIQGLVIARKASGDMKEIASKQFDDINDYRRENHQK